MEEKQTEEQQMVSSEIVRRLQLDLEVRMERMVERKLMDVAMRSYLESYVDHSSYASLLHPNSFRSLHTINSNAPLDQPHDLPFQRDPTQIVGKPVAKSSNQQLLQTTPSSSMIDMKRKTQSYEDKDSVINKCLQKKKKWYCSVCQVSATHEGGFKLHLQGKKHLSNLQNSDSINAVEKYSQLKGSASSVSVPEQEEKTPVSTKWHCLLCQVSVTSKSLLISHYEGKKHKSKQTKLGFGQNSQNVVSLDQISEGVEERGHTNVNDHFANKEILDPEMRDEDSNLSDKVSVLNESKREECLKEAESMEKNDQEIRHDELKSGCWFDEEMSKFVKYWYCEMCDKGTSGEEAMASHRKSDEHMTLLMQKGGNVIFVSRIPKK